MIALVRKLLVLRVSYLAIVAALFMQATNGWAEGTIVFRGLTTGIEPSWIANTSGNCYCSWESDSETQFVRTFYSGSTGHDYGLNHKLVDRNKYHLYVKFWSRQNDYFLKGPKHFKIFGQGIPTAYSNMTFGLASYGKEYGVYYGDKNYPIGTNGGNDNTVEYRFTGVVWQGTSVSRPGPTVVTKMNTPTGPILDGNWHEWGYYVKFNDDGQKNGEVIVMLDGVEIFHLTEMYNRSDGHPPLDAFGISSYFPGGGYTFTRDYRDVRLAYDGWPASTDLQGNWTGAVAPSAPSLSVE